jgi:hypothetical protein
VSGQDEQMVPLIECQAKSTRDGSDHRLGWLRPAATLDSTVVVSRHAAQRGNLFAPKAGGTSALTAWESDVVGLQRFAAGA